MSIIPTFTKLLEKVISTNVRLALLLQRYYEPIVKREVKLGQIKDKDQVICIGGGALPWTAIEIAKQSGANVDVIDCDPQAVKIAKKFLKLLNLDNKIHVKVADGQTVDVSKYSVAHIALQAYPQEKILDHLFESSPNNTRILVRCPKNGISCLYNACLPNCYQETKTTTQTNSTMKSTLLFIKAPRRDRYEESGLVSNRGQLTYPLTMER